MNIQTAGDQDIIMSRLHCDSKDPHTTSSVHHMEGEGWGERKRLPHQSVNSDSDTRKGHGDPEGPGGGRENGATYETRKTESRTQVELQWTFKLLSESLILVFRP